MQLSPNTTFLREGGLKIRGTGSRPAQQSAPNTKESKIKRAPRLMFTDASRSCVHTTRVQSRARACLRKLLCRTIDIVEVNGETGARDWPLDQSPAVDKLSSRA